MARLRSCFLSAVLLLLVTGCGYTRTARTSPLVQGRALHVALFANRTYQPNIEAEFRKALVDELALRGEDLRPENAAELILSGELEAAPLATTAYSAADKAMIYRFSLTATLQLTERQSGKIIWKTVETMRQEYPATADLSLQRNSSEAALTTLCSALAKTIAQKMNHAF